MHTSLFAPAPRRNGRLALTLAGSLLFHGSLIGVAAFWPTPPVVPADPVISLVDNQPGDPPPGPLVPAESTPSEHDPVQPELKVTDPVDAPPLAAESNPDDMSLSTPVPRAKPRPASSATAPRTARASSGLPATGSPSGATGSGAASGVRWNKPKPAYPSALRLARVQGSGVVRVTTDGSGRVVNATIVQSTGNTVLDDNTCRSARAFWSGPPNSALSVPITYQLQ